MIELRHISKWYGQFQVITDCSTVIHKGKVVVIYDYSGLKNPRLLKP
jgi:glutamate/aspartate transport system ATP-binding protein